MRMKTYPNLKELLFSSYSGLQTLAVAIQQGKDCYDRALYRFRESVIKKYRSGELHISDLYSDNIRKMIDNGKTCWYCGQNVSVCGKLSADHIFPRVRGGTNNGDNLIMACRHCNSSKGDKDLLAWYYEQGKFPPTRVLVHFLKIVYQYADKHCLLETSLEELSQMALPFDFRYLPRKYPQPIDASETQPTHAVQQNPIATIA